MVPFCGSMRWGPGLLGTITTAWAPPGRMPTKPKRQKTMAQPMASAPRVAPIILSRDNPLIIGSVSELVFVRTTALNILRINPAVRQTTGYAEVELIRSPLGRWVRLRRTAGGQTAATAEILAAAPKDGRSLLDQPAFPLDQPGVESAGRRTLVPLRDDNRVVGGGVTLRTTPPQPPNR